MVYGHAKKKPKKPDWVQEEELVYNWGIARFYVRLLKLNEDEPISEDNPLIIRLRREYFDTDNEEWVSDQINIKRVEYWEELKRIIDENFASKIGWISKEEALKKIKEKPSEETVKEVIDKRPTIILDFVDGADFEKMDINQLSDLIQKMYNRGREVLEKYVLLFDEIVERSTKRDEKYIENFNEIVDKITLYGITSTLNYVLYRKSKIDLFEKMILDDTTYELKGNNSIHRRLEKDIWLLGEDYIILKSNKSLKNLIGKELAKRHKKYEKLRPDFACVTYGNQKLVIAEIKRPKYSITMEDIDNVEIYLSIASSYSGKKFNDAEAYLIVNKIPRALRDIVDKRSKIGINVRTYQEIINDARNRYGQLLEILEEEMRDDIGE